MSGEVVILSLVAENGLREKARERAREEKLEGSRSRVWL